KINQFVPKQGCLSSCRIERSLYLSVERNILAPCSVRRFNRVRQLIGSTEQTQKCVASANLGHADLFEHIKYVLTRLIHAAQTNNKRFNRLQWRSTEHIRKLLCRHARNTRKSAQIARIVSYRLRHGNHHTAQCTTAHLSTHTGLRQRSSKS